MPDINIYNTQQIATCPDTSGIRPPLVNRKPRKLTPALAPDLAPILAPDLASTPEPDLVPTLPQALVKALIPALILILLTSACNNGYTPKPTGYLRVDYPEKAYKLYDAQPYFSFEIPAYSYVEKDTSPGADAGWINVVIPDLNGKIHLSYKPVHNNLGDYIADSRTLAYKHSVKAEGIEESPFIERDQRRYGMVYDLDGDVASAVQFFVTDSTSHFLRGSLYFNAPPNRDSLNPVIAFLREDIIHLIESTEWKY